VHILAIYLLHGWLSRAVEFTKSYHQPGFF
jgi:hypothetical protein